MGYVMNAQKWRRGKLKKVMWVLLFIISSILLIGCKDKISDDRISIVTTNFVQYSFVKEIVGDRCGVKMVLRPGQDSHSFDPTINSIIDIKKADMFIYTSEYVETWASKIIAKLEDDSLNVIESGKGIIFQAASHDHIDDHTHEEDEDHTGHNHTFDPHIWTNIKNAIVMVQNISNAIISLDPDNKDYYYQNTQVYINRLRVLEQEYREFFVGVDSAKIYFVSPFSFLYLCEEYKIEYVSLYATCSTEVEPSVADLINIINDIKKSKAKYIYIKELVSSDVADKIAEVTNTKVLTLHSADNVSVNEFKKGITYYDIMKNNLNSLKKGLS